MTNATVTAPRGAAGWRLPAASVATWPLALLVSLLAVQFSLIFVKSFNWDEYLHFSMVYQLRDGTLARPFQTLLARVLSWAPYVADDLITQMMVARVFVWSTFLVGLGAIYGLARQFVPREDAVWATLAYLAVGNVFVHGFAIRTDPLAMAALMLALYLLASRRVGWGMAFGVGVLVGLAGMLTVKAIFYAPCFAGIAWLRLSQANEKRRTLMGLAAILPVAAATFSGIYLFHRAGLAPIAAAQNGSSFLANGLQWLTDGLIRQPRHTIVAVLTAPVFVYALFKSRSAWRESGLSRDTIIALAGLCVPLLVILFYRNVFPYFFVFILAPVAVALAPAMAKLRRRHGRLMLAVALCVVPFVKFASEPRYMLERQRALIGYVHRQFPAGTPYFDYGGMIADYPRIIDHLVSGIGLENYKRRGIPVVAQAVEKGQLAFVIDNKRTGPIAEVLLSADAAALRENYVHVWGRLWLAGEEIPEGSDSAVIDIPAAGVYSADSAITIDGKAYRRGEIVSLSAGRHIVDGPRSGRTVLWRGKRLPAAAPQVPAGALFTDF